MPEAHRQASDHPSLSLFLQDVQDLNRQTGASMDPDIDPSSQMQSNTRHLMSAVTRLPQLSERQAHQYPARAAGGHPGEDSGQVLHRRRGLSAGQGRPGRRRQPLAGGLVLHTPQSPRQVAWPKGTGMFHNFKQAVACPPRSGNCCFPPCSSWTCRLSAAHLHGATCRGDLGILTEISGDLYTALR